MVEQFSVDTPGQGLHDITSQVGSLVRKAGIKEGLCTLFVRHTSASLSSRRTPTRRRSATSSAG